MASETINRDWVKRALETSGKTQSALAKALGVDPAAVSRMLREGGRRIQAEEIDVIKRFFREGNGDEEPADGHTIIPGESLVGRRDLPIYASAEGGEGSIILDYDPVDHVKRPLPLESVRGGYGLIVTGESMIPACRPGDILLLNPHMPPRVEDIVVLFRAFRSDTQATVKEYRGATDKIWRVRRYQPQEEDFTLPRDEWRQCHVSVGKYSRR
jgi:phage repressor protein C with HTH and peptisase S24 domain